MSFQGIHQLPTLKVLPLAVLRSFSSLSGLALRNTFNLLAIAVLQLKRKTPTLEEVRRPPSHTRVNIGLETVLEGVAPLTVLHSLLTLEALI